MNDPEKILHVIDVLLHENNFTKAATELYFSQPYLTQLIKKVEAKVGTKIINRDEVPFTLTEAGLIYYQYLEKLTFENQEVTRKLTKFSHPETEVIRVGILESLGSYLLPELMPIFLQKHPHVQVQLFESWPRKSERRLLNEELDCYIGQTPENISRGIKFVINGGELYYIVIPQNSKYFKKDRFILKPKELNVKELLQQSFVLSKSESAIRHQINGVFQRYHEKPRIVMESNSVITVANLAIKGLGLTISSASILKRLQKKPINLLPLDPELIQIRYFIAVKKGISISPTLLELIHQFQVLNLTQTIK